MANEKTDEAREKLLKKFRVGSVGGNPISYSIAYAQADGSVPEASSEPDNPPEDDSGDTADDAGA